MNLVARTLAPAALVAVGVMNAAPIHADDSSFFGQRNAYVANNATPVVIPCPPKAGQGSSCPNTASPSGRLTIVPAPSLERRQPGRIVGNPEGARARGKRDTPRIL